MSRFTEKTAIITGGTSGIGLATATRLKAEGATVLVTGSRQESLDAARAVLGDEVIYLKNDSGAAEGPAALAAAAKEYLGHVDVLYLNAGFGRFAPLDHVDPADFGEEFNVNVRGPLLQAQALKPLMREGGSVLITSSVAHQMGLEAGHIYSATKGAVRTLVRTLAREFAPLNIRVNSVAPGPIGTDFFNRTGLSEEQISGFAEQIQGAVPLGRFGTPDEVAAVSAFLLSSDASYVTGSEYVVDGGMSEL